MVEKGDILRPGVRIAKRKNGSKRTTLSPQLASVEEKKWGVVKNPA